MSLRAKIRKMRIRVRVGLAVLFSVMPLAALAQPPDALLVLAHGAPKGEWNSRVLRIVEQVEWPGPKEAAFLMGGDADHDLDHAIRRLEAAGAARIVVVPLMISSYGEHYDEIRYYVGELKVAPEHVHGPVLQTRAEFLLTPGLDDHPIVSCILAGYVQGMSQEPAKETLVLIAHGPNKEDYDRRWFEALGRQARWLQELFGFRRSRVFTLRDDASPEIREGATARLRQAVREASTDSRVLVLPVLISSGGIQKKIRERLDGLAFTMSEKGLADDPLLARWILESARERIERAQNLGPSNAGHPK